MTGFFDKLPEISPKKQAPTQKPVFDPYSFLNLRPEPQTAEDRFKEAKELLSAESNTAIQYLKAAAEEEHAASLDFLGMLYATGQLLERDPKRAADLFRKAAVLGETNAKFHLAMALREGFGVRQNLDESFAWLRVAAKEKSPEAMFALAEAYDQGLGVETNPEIAETFFSQAALKGEKRAIMRMVRLTSEGSHLNPKLCLHWLFKGAAAKIPVCLLAVGRYWLPYEVWAFWKKALFPRIRTVCLSLDFFGRALDLSRPILWPQSSTVTSPLLSEAGKLLKNFPTFAHWRKKINLWKPQASRPFRVHSSSSKK